jgi:glycosyltransferase involved in cell wall biosynthesis
MIRTIANVIRGEGVMSALRRAGERIEEAAQGIAMRMRSGSSEAEILHFCASSIAPRTGGVAVQLMTQQHVALLHPGGLDIGGHRRRVTTIAEAMAITGAKAIQLEGTSNAPFDELLRFPLIVSIHDLTLFDVDRELARRVLVEAKSLIFPSRFLLEKHRELVPTLQGEIVEPSVPSCDVQVENARGIAFAGAVKRHKGAHLLPDVARALDTQLHVFGGGEVELFRPLRALPNVVIHGYYRAGMLPSLLARHRIGLVLLPSIVPEAFSLVLSEAWQAGARVIAFDHGAQAERIRAHGGGWLVPLESGARGLVDAITRHNCADSSS